MRTSIRSPSAGNPAPPRSSTRHPMPVGVVAAPTVVARMGAAGRTPRQSAPWPCRWSCCRSSPALSSRPARCPGGPGDCRVPAVHPGHRDPPLPPPRHGDRRPRMDRDRLAPRLDRLRPPVVDSSGQPRQLNATATAQCNRDPKQPSSPPVPRRRLRTRPRHRHRRSSRGRTPSPAGSPRHELTSPSLCGNQFTRRELPGERCLMWDPCCDRDGPP